MFYKKGLQAFILTDLLKTDILLIYDLKFPLIFSTYYSQYIHS